LSVACTLKLSSAHLITPHMSTYLEELTLAITRTQEHGLKVPVFHAEPARRLLNKRTIGSISQLVSSMYFGDIVKNFNKKCLSVNRRMAPAISKLLGCEVLYTLGRIERIVEGGYCSGFDDEFISSKLLLKHNEPSIDIHAWLTLPSMELIDLTIFTTVGKAKSIPSWYGEAILRHADEITDMSYKPVLVGDDFLVKAHIKVE
jgi:hypothetical protein